MLHASVPQKSSTQRNPPLSRYCLKRCTSALDNAAVPTSEPTNRTLEQLIVGEPYDPVVDVAGIVPADTDLGHLREAGEQVDLAKRVVGAPPDSPGFRPLAAEHPLADGEATVVEVHGWNPDANSCAFADTKPLRHRHRAGDGDEREDKAMPAGRRRMLIGS